MTKTLLRRLAVSGTAVLAVVLAGCTGFAAIDSESVDQVDLIGDARISTTLCLGALVDTGDSEDFEPFGQGPACLDEPAELPDRSGIRLREDATTVAARIARDATRPTHDDVAEAMLAGISFHQVLVSYRVPEDAEAPETIEAPVTVPEDVQEDADDMATELSCALQEGHIFGGCYDERGLDEEEDLVHVDFPDTVTFTRSDSLSDEMAENGEAADGQRWVGYVSEQVPLGLTGHMTLPAEFGLPVPSDGSPYAGPFEHETVVGRRDAATEEDFKSLTLMLDLVDFDEGYFPFFRMGSENLRSAVRGLPVPIFAEGDPDRPVDCDEGLDGEIFPDLPTVCGFETPEGVVDDETLATNDLRVSGGEATAEQGRTASVPFTLRFAGPAASRALALSGGTDLPFSAATARTGSWTPAADETRTELVDVPVPADARPGVYAVTFAAEVGGEMREATGRLTVTAAPGAPVVPQQQGEQSRSPQRERLYIGRKGTVAFGYVCPAQLGPACRKANAVLWGMRPSAGAGAAAKGKLARLASKTFRAKPGKRVRVKIKVGKKTRRLLVKAGRRMNGRLVVTAGGNRQSRSILLRRG